MSKKTLGWILALSLPGIGIIRFLATFIFFALGFLDINLESITVIKSFVNYGLGFLALLSIIATPIGIILLISKGDNLIGNSIQAGWKTTKKYFWIILLLLFVSNLPSMISNAFDSILQYIPGATRMVYSQLQNMEIAEPVGMRSTAVTLLAIVSGLVGSRLGLGMIRSYIMMLHGTKPVVKDLGYASWIYVARLIGASFLVGLSVIIGLIALIIPGIFIAARLSMVKYLISEGYELIDAIKTSRMMTKGNVWNLIGAWIVCFGIVILGVVLLLVGLLWAIPTVSLIQTYIYLELKKNIPTIPAKGHM